MAARMQRLGSEAEIPDQENKLKMKTAKGVFEAKPIGRSRCAFGELGNKLNEQQDQAAAAKKTAKAAPLAHPQPRFRIPVTSGRTNATTKDPVKAPTKDSQKENVNVNKTKKTETGSTLQRQESLPKVVPLQARTQDKLKSSWSNMQLEIYDPDLSSKNDTQFVYEYLQDIFLYLRELEERFPVRENFLSSHRTTPRMRAILINWLVEVHQNFRICLETLHLCVSIVDRYLQENKDVGRETLQLIGTASLLIAGKYEEIYIPELSDFVFICDDSFDAVQILEAERKIIKCINFNLGRPSSIHFLRRYSKIARVKTEHHCLAKYLLELMLLEYELCSVKPSVQAAAAICLSVAVLDEVSDAAKVWTPTLIHYTTYKYRDFRDVMVRLAQLVGRAEAVKYQAVYKKYSRPEFGKISMNLKLKGSPIKKLSLMSVSAK